MRESGAGKELVVIAQEHEDFFASAEQTHVVDRREYSYLSLYLQMLRGLEEARYDTVFLAEDDVLYPAGYFDFLLPDRYRVFYNVHSYVANFKEFFATDCRLTSNGVGDRGLLLLAVRQRVYHLRSGGTVTWAEPGFGGHDDFSCEIYRSQIPTVDIRHELNLTGHRENESYLDRLDYWGRHRDLVAMLGLSG